DVRRPPFEDRIHQRRKHFENPASEADAASHLGEDVVQTVSLEGQQLLALGRIQPISKEIGRSRAKHLRFERPQTHGRKYAVVELECMAAAALTTAYEEDPTDRRI